MAIRFTKDYNKRIRQEVSNFNRRRKTAIEAGLKSVPDKVYVSELKRRYDKREDLNRELKLLNEFKRNSLREIETSGGIKAIEWDIQHIKNNLEQAKKYYKREEAILSERAGRFPSEREDLESIIRNRRALENSIDNLSQEEFEDMRSSVNTFIRRRNKWGAGYRGFMSEVEEVMDRVGIEKKDKDKFFSKFKKLSNEEFFYIYEDSDLIKRIYALIDSPKENNKMNVEDPKIAEGYVNDLMNQIDTLIDEAKNRK